MEKIKKQAKCREGRKTNRNYRYMYFDIYFAKMFFRGIFFG